METSGFEFNDDLSCLGDSSEVSIKGVLYESKSGPFRILSVVFFGRHAVAKCLKEKYADSQAHIALLRREGSLQSSLNHSGIPQVFDVREIDGIGLSIIMERIKGVTLKQYLCETPLSFPEAFRILEDICDITEYIHSKGTIHRDLKPENVIITEDSGEVKIIDFGLSHGNSFADFPIKGGTPGFSAPEQMTTSAVASPEADVWSIGRIMQAMVGSDNDSRWCHWSEVMSRALSPEPTDRPRRPSDIPASINRLILRSRRRRGILCGLIGIVCVVALEYSEF